MVSCRRRTDMKAFNVYLRDGRTATVHAETYRREGKQYVFDKAGSGEIQFFVDSEVAGISEAITSRVPAASRPDDSNRSLLARTEQEAIVRTLAECAGNRTQ